MSGPRPSYTQVNYVHRGELLRACLEAQLPAAGDQVAHGGTWYVVLKRYWHLESGLVEITLERPTAGGLGVARA